MSEPFYIAEAEIEKVEGVHRRARLAAGGTLDFGVHGPVKEHYRLEGAPERPLPVDYVVASAGG